MGAAGTGGTDAHINPSKTKKGGEVHRYGGVHGTKDRPSEYGTDCFAMLRGMFAIAIVDQDRRRLVLARDRIGKKPLYLGELSPGVLGFGSELKTLLAVPDWQPRISMDAVQDFFSLFFILPLFTIFSSVNKIKFSLYLLILT